MQYKEKLEQANKEAKAAVVGLACTIVVWALLGFGVATTDIVVLSTPLWIITGTFGTFLFAAAVAVVMAKCVFKDVGLDDIEQVDVEGLAQEAAGARSDADAKEVHDAR